MIVQFKNIIIPTPDGISRVRLISPPSMPPSLLRCVPLVWVNIKAHAAPLHSPDVCLMERAASLHRPDVFLMERERERERERVSTASADNPSWTHSNHQRLIGRGVPGLSSDFANAHVELDTGELR
jgi:hypothetical protein